MNPYLITVTTVINFFLLNLCSAETAKNIKDIEFAKIKGHSLKLDLYLPAKNERSTLVVWIHGGGWQKGSKNDCKIKWLTEHGYSVASISYRLSQVAKFPAQLHDCKGAIRWLRANASKYGYETQHIVVAGSSAGGHLAALIGTTSGNERLEGDVGGNLDQASSVSAIIDYYGATDFILRSKTQPSRANEVGSVVYNLLGGGADKKVELAKLASAAHHVTKDDPPLLIFHGDKDKTVLIDQSEAITKVYKSKGLSVQMNVLLDKKHGGTVFYQGENRQRVLKFLDKVLRAKS
ncbi:MAG: alpha/beta hydrolase [Verrucomicrobiales bacterium]|nr:alpha/beta hydrolase [Verrucomicrobiales bacterium]